MKITYTQHVSDPALRGTTTHLPAHIAQVLVATGQATAVPFPRRGGPGWLEAMAEVEALRQPNPTSTITSWGAIKTIWGGVLVIKNVGRGDEVRFKVPPSDCPRDVVALYNQLKGINDADNAEQLAAAKREQAANDVAPQKLW